MRALRKRLDALDSGRRFLKVGDLLDFLNGEPLPEGLRIDPDLARTLAELPRG